MRDIVAESRVQGSISSATRAKDVRSTAREFSVSSSQLLPLCLGASASWHRYGKVVIAVIGVVVRLSLLLRQNTRETRSHNPCCKCQDSSQTSRVVRSSLATIRLPSRVITSVQPEGEDISGRQIHIVAYNRCFDDYLHYRHQASPEQEACQHKSTYSPPAAQMAPSKRSNTPRAHSKNPSWTQTRSSNSISGSSMPTSPKSINQKPSRYRQLLCLRGKCPPGWCTSKKWTIEAS